MVVLSSEAEISVSLNASDRQNLVNATIHPLSYKHLLHQKGLDESQTTLETKTLAHNRLIFFSVVLRSKLSLNIPIHLRYCLRWHGCCCK